MRLDQFFFCLLDGSRRPIFTRQPRLVDDEARGGGGEIEIERGVVCLLVSLYNKNPRELKVNGD